MPFLKKMKVRKIRLIKILLSSILLSCFSIQAHAASLGEAGDIAVPSVNAPDMGVLAPLMVFQGGIFPVGPFVLSPSDRSRTQGRIPSGPSKPETSPPIAWSDETLPL